MRLYAGDYHAQWSVIAPTTAAFAVYAGHGNINALQWGNPDAANRCGLNLASSMRLGQASGDVARLAIFVTGCTMNVPNLQTSVGVSAAGQYLGWHNSPSVPDWVLSDFYATTDTFILGDGPISNRSAWMSVGQVRPFPAATYHGQQARQGALIKQSLNLETIDPSGIFNYTLVFAGGRSRQRISRVSLVNGTVAHLFL